jgi:hypothetical protein
MQRTATVFLACLAALALTGCPDKEKKVEKEEPAAPTAVDKNADEKNAAAEDEHGEEQADEHGEEPSDKKPVKKKRADKAGDEKDQGGW